MCNHDWVKVNDVRVCQKCGLTVTRDGKMFFDFRFPGFAQNKKKARRKKKCAN